MYNVDRPNVAPNSNPSYPRLGERTLDLLRFAPNYYYHYFLKLLLLLRYGFMDMHHDQT